MKTKAFTFLVLIAGILILAGCESMSSRVHERFAEVPPQVRTFNGDLKTVYYAAQTAFKRLDFNLTRSALGTGRVEAASPIRNDPTLGDSRQIVATVHVEKATDTTTEVSLLVSQQIQDSSFAQPTAQNLKDHGFYEMYFAMLKQVLAEQAGQPAK